MDANDRLLSSDRVLLLLALVPYLKEHGPTTIDELAERFQVDPHTLRNLISFLGTAGIPGETLTYQHDDLFDIDWDLFEQDDTVALTHTVAIDDAPRFTGIETAALLAGLDALRPMLSESDTRIADRLQRTLRDVAAQNPAPVISVEPESPDPRLALIVSALENQTTLRFEYRGSSDTSRSREVEPTALTEHGSVWYLTGHDRARDAERTFRVDLMTHLHVGEAFVTERAGHLEVRETERIVALVAPRLVPVLKGFQPKVLGTTADGRVRISVEAWHPGTAVRLVQQAPGEIEISAPPHARETAREWCEAALRAHEK